MHQGAEWILASSDDRDAPKQNQQGAGIEVSLLDKRPQQGVPPSLHSSFLGRPAGLFRHFRDFRKMDCDESPGGVPGDRISCNGRLPAPGEATSAAQKPGGSPGLDTAMGERRAYFVGTPF